MGVDDFLSCVVEVLREATKLLHFPFDEGIAELLDGAIHNGLVRLTRLEDLLAKWIERGLSTIARSCAEFNCEHRVSDAHGEMSARTDVVEYKVDVFGLALVVVRVVDGCDDTESSVGPVFDKWWSGVSIARIVIDDILVGTHYHDRRSRGPDTSCQRWWRSDVIGR